MVCRCCSIDGHDLIQNICKEEDARGPSNRQNQLQCNTHKTSLYCTSSLCVVSHTVTELRHTCSTVSTPAQKHKIEQSRHSSQLPNHDQIVGM